METLGQKIRTLRKQKKMTLQQLAGTYMTKGMLSLIENDKNQPSMESLNFIASQLGVSVSEIMQSGNEVLTNEIYLKLKDLLKVPALSYELEISNLLEPIIEQIVHNRKGAFIFQWYAFTRAIKGEKNLANQYLQYAKDIYIAMDDKNTLLDVENDFLSIYFITGEYKTAFQKGVALYELYKDDPEITDPNLIPRLLISIAAYSYDDFEATNLIYYNRLAEEKCIENKTFKPLSNIYKSQCFAYMISNDDVAYQQTLKKFDLLKQLNPNDFGYLFDYYSTQLIYHFYIQDFETLQQLLMKQNQFIDQDKYQNETNKNLTSFWTLLEGITLYHLKDIKKSKEILSNLELTFKFQSPADIAIFAQRYTYLSLIEQQLGNLDSAKEYINFAMKEIETIPSNHFTTFTEETYQSFQK